MNWKDLASTNLPTGAVHVYCEGRDALRIENTNGTSLRVTIWNLDKTNISAMVDGIQGEVRYNAVRGDGYLICGWMGATVGCLGGLIGLLSARGKARGLVSALLKILIGVGVVFGGSGIVALIQHQPYPVWFPLILLGVILLAVCPPMLFRTSRRYEELELRRMHSIDAAG